MKGGEYMKKLLTKAYKLAYLAPLALASTAHAQVSIDFPTNFAGFSSQDVKVTIQNIIRIIVGFLGIIRNFNHSCSTSKLAVFKKADR